MIHRQAITHIPLSQYAFANTTSNMTIRLRAAKGNLRSCTLWYGDRVCQKDPVEVTALPMKKVAEEILFDWYEATFDTPYSRVCYYFELESQDGEQLLYYADLFEQKPPKTRSEFYQYPFIRREELAGVPDWLRHAVVYNIFPDSFASGKRYLSGQSSQMKWERGLTLNTRLGGTIRGIFENLDYICDLGFNCLYLNPIFTAGEYHRYDLLDYFHVCPNLGSDAEFRQLVDAAHEKGMKVLVDGVFNHCSWQFFAFDDVVKNGEQSQYRDWFYDLTFPVVRPDNPTEIPNYACFAYERKMPKLNSSNPEVREYFQKVCAYWITEFHVDGWRLDVANEVDREFWRGFRRAALQAKPDAVMIGEIWENSESWLRGDTFDSTMNYDFRKHCRDFFGTGELTAEQFHSRIIQMLYRYPTGITQGQLNLLDSHDVSRFLTECGGDVRRLHLAEVFLFTAPGVPCLFYGDELGISGREELEFRRPMAWNAPPHDHRSLIRQLTALRKEEAIVSGTYELRKLGESGLYVYARRSENTVITVALNAGESSVHLSCPNGAILLSEGLDGETLAGFGYAIWMEQADPQ